MATHARLGMGLMLSEYPRSGSPEKSESKESEVEAKFTMGNIRFLNAKAAIWQTPSDNRKHNQSVPGSGSFTIFRWIE